MVRRACLVKRSDDTFFTVNVGSFYTFPSGGCFVIHQSIAYSVGCYGAIGQHVDDILDAIRSRKAASKRHDEACAELGLRYPDLYKVGDKTRLGTVIAVSKKEVHVIDRSSDACKLSMDFILEDQTFRLTSPMLPVTDVLKPIIMSHVQ